MEEDRLHDVSVATQETNTRGGSKRIGEPAKTHQRRGISSAVPYLAGRPRPNTLSGAASYWQAMENDRTIGVGTVGLFQDQQKDETLPEETSARIKGVVVVGPPAYMRKMRDYLNWREKHNPLFSALKAQDGKEWRTARLRQLRAKARRQEEEECKYALAIKQLRQRGWSVLANVPRENTRLRQIKAEREAFRAECEENMVHKIREASKQREIILGQLAVSKDERMREASLVRDAARLEREMMITRREVHSAHVREQASNARAEREVEREYFRKCAAMEDTCRRSQLSALRERVFAKTCPSGFVSTFSSDVRGTGDRYPPGDWHNTFNSPLRRLPNASDDNYRRQWMAQLQEERMESARAEVEMVRARRLKVSIQRDFAYHGNCERAEALRHEREVLRERKQQLDEEVERFQRVIHQQEAEDRKRREDTINSLRESRRLHASRLRQAIEEEEQLARTAYNEDLRRLQEHAAELRRSMSPSPRHAPPPPPPPPLEREKLVND
ncbi:hypothetical protein TRSC58_03932 [Trypanosoma rangeli SC58]|uniref:Uncharacterized protein n=1 Tax=Trypanosoma rangeli SC58 TaxID=429131 RepID=A0A061J218_TRYRA|nr:hypothetical protein TRSC58_03932 [Trypanosoma rangeli SC58]